MIYLTSHNASVTMPTLYPVSATTLTLTLTNRQTNVEANYTFTVTDTTDFAAIGSITDGAELADGQYDYTATEGSVKVSEGVLQLGISAESVTAYDTNLTRVVYGE